jgi:hypothetical protein
VVFESKRAGSPARNQIVTKASDPARLWVVIAWLGGKRAHDELVVGRKIVE